MRPLPTVVTVLVAGWLAVAAGCRSPIPAAAGPPPDAVRPEWDRAFEAYGGRGVFVLYDPATGQTLRSDAARAAERSLPASTFKVYNALVALETGAVGDPDSVFAWDGVERSVPAWNRDHTLRSGMEASVVWLYQRVARRVGRDGYRRWFAREPYGNGAVGDSVHTFWLDGSLAVSPDEQVVFFDRLRRGALAFRPGVQDTVRGLLVRYDEAGGTVVGKTGWGQRAGGGDVGWLAGWVARDDGREAVFALHVEPVADGFDMGPARLRIARTLLTTEGWLDALR